MSIPVILRMAEIEPSVRPQPPIGADKMFLGAPFYQKAGLTNLNRVRDKFD
jgi:hypothetical protein